MEDRRDRDDGGDDGAGRGVPKVYCVIPRALASKLHEPLRRHFRDDPQIEVIVERRAGERRAAVDRRGPGRQRGARERRGIQSVTGRRVGDRRASLVSVEAPELPRKARAHTGSLLFFERLEPSGQHSEDLDTAHLVTRFQAGEPELFGTLYMRYFERVYSYLNIAVKNPHDAEDIAQQVFVKALEALPRFEQRGQPFRGWLFRIARNSAISHLEKQGRLDPTDPRELGRRRERAEPTGVEVEAFNWITDRELLMFVERLSLAQRQVLVLRFMLGLKTAEIAEVLGRTITDVRSLQHRALGVLRDRLAALGRRSSSDRGLRMRRWLKAAPVLRERRFALHD